MRPLRITLVEFSPGGGLFQFSFQLATALAERGHQVELVTGPDPELRSTHPGLHVLSILPTWRPGSGNESALFRKVRRVGRAFRHIGAWLIVGRHLRRSRPDVVQWSSWRFAIDGLSAALIASRRWAGVSIDLAHSPLPLQEQHPTGSFYRRGVLLDLGLRTGYRAMDSVVVLGEATRHELIGTWTGVTRCDVVPHGDEQALATGAGLLPLPSQCAPHAMLFGFLTAYKGIDLLLDAWPLVREHLPSAELTIAGSVGQDLDLASMIQRIDRLPGATLRAGYVPLPDVAALIGSARVVVAPYHRSNASGAVRLAQTLGRPVVVTDVGDLAASVRHGRSGLVVVPDDPHQLADALTRILSDPPLADRMGVAGRLDLERDASWSVVAEKVEAIYVRELSRRRRGP